MTTDGQIIYELYVYYIKPILFLFHTESIELGAKKPLFNIPDIFAIFLAISFPT